MSASRRPHSQHDGTARAAASAAPMLGGSVVPGGDSPSQDPGLTEGAVAIPGAATNESTAASSQPIELARRRVEDFGGSRRRGSGGGGSGSGTSTSTSSTSPSSTSASTPQEAARAAPPDDAGVGRDGGVGRNPGSDSVDQLPSAATVEAGHRSEEFEQATTTVHAGHGDTAGSRTPGERSAPFAKRQKKRKARSSEENKQQQTEACGPADAAAAAAQAAAAAAVDMKKAVKKARAAANSAAAMAASKTAKASAKKRAKKEAKDAAAAKKAASAAAKKTAAAAAALSSPAAASSAASAVPPPASSKKLSNDTDAAKKVVSAAANKVAASVCKPLARSCLLAPKQGSTVQAAKSTKTNTNKNTKQAVSDAEFAAEVDAASVAAEKIMRHASEAEAATMAKRKAAAAAAPKKRNAAADLNSRARPGPSNPKWRRKRNRSRQAEQKNPRLMKRLRRAKKKKKAKKKNKKKNEQLERKQHEKTATLDATTIAAAHLPTATAFGPGATPDSNSVSAADTLADSKAGATAGTAATPINITDCDSTTSPSPTPATATAVFPRCVCERDRAGVVCKHCVRRVRPQGVHHSSAAARQQTLPLACHLQCTPLARTLSHFCVPTLSADCHCCRCDGGEQSARTHPGYLHIRLRSTDDAFRTGEVGVCAAAPIPELKAAILESCFPGLQDCDLSPHAGGVSMQRGSLQDYMLSVEPDGRKTVWVRLSPANGGMDSGMRVSSHRRAAASQAREQP